ncbi:hypothetical protein EJB05_54491, partial [Eragrostis curvula]
MSLLSRTSGGGEDVGDGEEVLAVILREQEPLPNGDLVDRFIREGHQPPPDLVTSSQLVAFWKYRELCVAHGQDPDQSDDVESFDARLVEGGYKNEEEEEVTSKHILVDEDPLTDDMEPDEDASELPPTTEYEDSGDFSEWDSEEWAYPGMEADADASHGDQSEGDEYVGVPADVEEPQQEAHISSGQDSEESSVGAEDSEASWPWLYGSKELRIEEGLCRNPAYRRPEQQHI